MNASDKTRLRHGPYSSPAVRVGAAIQCEMAGLVEVARWKDCGSIMWPQRRAGTRYAMILTGDLVRAVEHEAEIAVAAHWSVSPWTVKQWRRALEVPSHTVGTLELKRDVTLSQPEVLAHLQPGASAGMPRPATAIEAQRRSVTGRKKPEGFGQKSRKRWKNRSEQEWSPEHLKLLGTMTDSAVAAKLGRSSGSVKHARQRRGIPRFRVRDATS